MQKRKWYLSLPVIVICFSLWFFIIPLVIGIVLFILRIIDDSKREEMIQSDLSRLEKFDNLEKQVTSLEEKKHVLKLSVGTLEEINDFQQHLISLKNKQEQLELVLAEQEQAYAKNEEQLLELQKLIDFSQKTKKTLETEVVSLKSEVDSLVASKTIGKQDIQADIKINDASLLQNEESESITTISIESVDKVSHSQKKTLMTFYVAGIKYREANLKKAINLAKKNYYFDSYDGNTAADLKEYWEDERVYEVPAKADIGEIILEKEDNNQYDSNAVKVILKVEDKLFHIGYVPRERTAKAREAIDFGNYSCQTYFTGGKYKIAEHDWESDKLKINNGTSGFDVEVKVFTSE